MLSCCQIEKHRFRNIIGIGSIIGTTKTEIKYVLLNIGIKIQFSPSKILYFLRIEAFNVEVFQNVLIDFVYSLVLVIILIGN